MEMIRKELKFSEGRRIILKKEKGKAEVRMRRNPALGHISELCWWDFQTIQAVACCGGGGTELQLPLMVQNC